MAANLTILLVSGLLLVLTVLYCQKRWSEFDLIDLYILFAGIYFGAYTFVKALLGDYSKYEPLTIVIVFGQIIMILAITFILWRFMPEHFRREVEIKSLLEQWKNVNSYVIFLFLAILLIIHIYGYEKYNIISHIDHGNLISAGKGLPYWFTSINVLSNDIILCTFIALVAKIISSENLVKKLWIIPLIVLLLMAVINGRRSLINPLIIGTILLFISQERELFQFRYLKIVLLLSLGILIFSNIFQAYRYVLQFPDSANPIEVKNPVSAALDPRYTLNNLKLRPSGWEFNYSIFRGQRYDNVPLQRGGIFWQGLKNSIPRIFWPQKEVVSLNDLYVKLYSLPEADYGKNNFGFTQVDFGYGSIIIMPILILIVTSTLVVINMATKNYPVLLLLLSGTVINYLINIEQNVTDIFILYRDLIVLTGVYLIGDVLLKMKVLFRPVQQGLLR